MIVCTSRRILKKNVIDVKQSLIEHLMWNASWNQYENIVNRIKSEIIYRTSSFDRIIDVKRIWSSILMKTSQNMHDRIKQTKWSIEHRAQF